MFLGRVLQGWGPIAVNVIIINNPIVDAKCDKDTTTNVTRGNQSKLYVSGRGSLGY